MTDDPNRNPDGTFAPGNDGGSGALHKGRATRRARIEHLDQKYDTLEKLMALFDRDPGGKLSPGKELLQMHPRDVALIMQSVGAIVGDDKRGERESFYDREEGKPIQRNEFSGPNGGAIEYADASQARTKLLGDDKAPGGDVPGGEVRGPAVPDTQG
jgi:hypothetical protein